MDNPDETPLEALLPAEVVAKIREVVAQVLSQQAQPRAPILEGNVYRPMPTAFSQSSASVDPQYILQALLKDPATLAKKWSSPEGVTAISSLGTAIATFLLLGLSVEQGQQTAAFQKQTAASEEATIEQAEQFWVDHKDQPQPTPKPTPEKRQRRARGTGSLKGQTRANRRKE
jgi:hypothetical protein